MAACFFCGTVTPLSKSQLCYSSDSNHYHRFYSSKRFILRAVSNSEVPKLGFGFGGSEKTVPCDRHVKVGSDYNNTVAADDVVSNDFVADGWISFLLLKCHSITEILKSLDPDPHRTCLLHGVENLIGSFLLLSLLFCAVSSWTRDPTYSKYIPVFWRFASIITFGWTLALLKTSGFTHISKYSTITSATLEKCIVVDKFISIGMILVGLVAFADGYHKDLLPLMNVGGFGGAIATAFSLAGMLKNVSCGFSIYLSDMFSTGDRVKVGRLEGKVVDTGLTGTTILSTNNFLVTSSNSKFFKEKLVNQSRIKLTFTEKHGGSLANDDVML